MMWEKLEFALKLLRDVCVQLGGHPVLRESQLREPEDRIIAGPLPLGRGRGLRVLARGCEMDS